MPLFSKFKRCFYLMSDELFNARTKPTKTGIRQYFDIVIFICFSIRLFFIIYLLRADYPDWYDFRRADMMVHFIHSYSGQLDYVVFFVAYLFYLIYFLFEWWCFRLDASGREWRAWHQLTVLSLDQYAQCRLSGSRLKQVKALKTAKFEEKLGQFSLSVGLVKSASRMLASFEIFSHLDDVDKEELQMRPLPLMPCLSWTVRARALKLMLVTEYIAYPLQLIILALYIFVYMTFAFTHPDWSSHSWLSIAYAILEAQIPLIMIVMLIRYFIFLLTLTILGTVIFTSHLIEWKTKVETFLMKQNKKCLLFSQQIPSNKALPPSGRPLMEGFLREHNLIALEVVSCSGQLWGKMIFATICTQIPINLIFVKKLLMVSSSEEGTTPASLRFTYIGVFVFQVIIFAVIFMPLGWCQKVYHSPKRLIPRFLLLTTGNGTARWWRLRLKYEDLYGRLMHGPKVALNVGELHAITYMTAAELLLSYVAYVLMVMSPDS